MDPLIFLITIKCLHAMTQLAGALAQWLVLRGHAQLARADGARPAGREGTRS